MPPWINSRRFHVRILKLVAFREENRIWRTGTVSETLAPAVNNVVLPGTHAAPDALRVKDLIARLKKTAPAMHKQTPEKIFWIKPEFHRSLIFPPHPSIKIEQRIRRKFS
jgi:hypothetical protein